MTVGALRRDMTVAEFMGWQLYYTAKAERSEAARAAAAGKSGPVEHRPPPPPARRAVGPNLLAMSSHDLVREMGAKRG